MTAALRIVAPVFPHVTQLDLTGPLQVLSRLPGAVVDVAWHRIEPVPTDSGFSLLPTTTLADAPPADVLLVPGGRGAFEAMEDPEVVAFVERQAATARHVLGVCTGAFVLGAAGLLRGRRATTHWASHPLLELLGATPVAERVVRDGTLITGGGVTSGIDAALVLAAELAGDAEARSIQLTLEYDPQPPFDAGHPSRPGADPEQVERAMAEARRDRGPIVERAARRRGDIG
ncbi:AraC family transcriptional regulator [Clavibacter michiganensis]|uniref:AraC family transcriptional regulator n=1 Tax=Clavibacter michiganensis TaxID=28447 RepID=A0A2S5VJU6_9MICO|nr:DJ-1/PfpI family protein [Clavibacter michiganensis]PPF63023.1 AraC family transcriptional regulator [Clavibacter michiganensis]